MPSGAQDFWVTGSRFFYTRDDVGGVKQPTLDLGVISPANPTLDIETLELVDSDGGVKNTVDQRVTKIDEAYEITCSNLNMDNLALLFLSELPAAFTQSAAHKEVDTHVIPGRIIKIHDSDADSTILYGLGAISGIYSGTKSEADLTDIVASTKTFTMTQDPSLSDGDPFIVKGTGLTDVKNSRSYTADGASAGAGPYTVVSNETPSSNETTVSGKLIYSATTAVYKQDVDWDVVSVDRGIARAIDGGAISVAGTLKVVFSTAALSGKRIINPQDFKGEVKGQAMLFYGRGNNAEQTVREAKVSIVPSSASFTADEHSNFVISVKVISDLTAANPAGRMLYFKGDVPDMS